MQWDHIQQLNSGVKTATVDEAATSLEFCPPTENLTAIAGTRSPGVMTRLDDGHAALGSAVVFLNPHANEET